MSVKQLTKILSEKWLLVVGSTLLGAILATVVAFLLPNEYQARATLYVSSQADNTTQAYQGGLLSEQRVRSYVELLGSSRVATAVVEDLRLNRSASEVASQLSANTQPDTVLLNVTAVDTDPGLAAAMANSAAGAFVSLVDQIEQPVGRAGPPSVVVRVVEQAALPTEAFSPERFTFAIVGLSIGLIVGLLGASIWTALDTSLKSKDELAEAASAPVIGTISVEKDVADKGLVTFSTSASHSQEMFRQLRTNLQFLDVDSERKVLLFTSSLPSEGKTTTCCNTAVAMADAGLAVCVVEGDLRRPKAADIFGLPREVGLSNCLTGRVRLNDALQRWGGGGLHVLASGPLPPNPSELLGSEKMRELLKELKGRYDVVLIDGAPLLPVADATALAPSCDGVVLMCRYGQTARGQVQSAALALANVGASLLGCVLTLAPRSRGGSGKYYGGYYGAYQTRGQASGSQEELDRLQTGSHDDVDAVTDAVRAVRPSPTRRSG